MTRVVLKEPFQENILPFQKPIFEYAKKCGFSCLARKRIPRWMHGFVAHFPLNFYIGGKKTSVAKIIMVSATHLNLMVFPDAYCSEIIPIVWDCWPQMRYKIDALLRLCKIKTIFFTQSENVTFFKGKYPNLNVLFLPEALDFAPYHIGDALENRALDVLEYGRVNALIEAKISSMNDINYQLSKRYKDFNELALVLSRAKIVICYPRSITNPEIANGLETLTLRYWECMYSKTLMVGKAPLELIELIGYNPVVESSINDLPETIRHILSNINSYQDTVDKNYNSAIKWGCWSKRLQALQEMLLKYGYQWKKCEITGCSSFY